jgi:hypothetical protein
MPNKLKGGTRLDRHHGAKIGAATLGERPPTSTRNQRRLDAKVARKRPTKVRV